MAVVSAKPNRALTGSIGNSTASYSIEFAVQVSKHDDGPIAIFNYFQNEPNLPWLGSIYSFRGEIDSYSFVTRLVPTKVTNSDFEWLVVVQYEQSSANPLDEDGNPAQNPLNQMRQFSFSFSPQQVPVEQAMYHGFYRISNGDSAIIVTPNSGYYNGVNLGDVILPCNSAGDAYDPPMLRERSDMILTCKINLPNYDANFARGLQDSVNFSDMQLDLTSTIYQVQLNLWKWQCKCVNVGGDFAVSEWTDDQNIKQRTFYWEVSYEFHIRYGLELLGMPPLGWSEWIPDRGYNRSAREGDPDGAGDVLPAPGPGDPLTARVKGRDGFPVSEPVNLDANGQPLGPTDAPRFAHFLGTNTSEMIGLPVGFTSWTPA